MCDSYGWCEIHLPEIYDVGMYDYTAAEKEVSETVTQLIDETIRPFIEDDDDTTVDELCSAADRWFKQYHAANIKAVPVVSAERITALQAGPQVDQHSAEWYTQRRNRLTASEFGDLFTAGRRKALLASKVDPTAARDYVQTTTVSIAQPDGTMIATYWGHRFEPVVRQIYEEEIAGRGVVCDTLGRFTHRTHPWLSASPDGLVVSGPLAGRLIEIKAPKSRKPGAFVPNDYYVQMQVQMEVCDLDAVDFLEACFAQKPTFHYETGTMSEELPSGLADAHWKGRVEVYGHHDNPTTWSYRYSIAVEDLEDAEWLTPAPTDVPLLESTVWWLVGWYPRTVLRNRRWWGEVGGPEAGRFWTDVECGRAAFVAPKVVGGWLGSS